MRDPRFRFAGVILARIGFETSREKEIAAHNAVRVAMSLGADAALITRTGSGNAFIEVMLRSKDAGEGHQDRPRDYESAARTARTRPGCTTRR